MEPYLSKILTTVALGAILWAGVWIFMKLFNGKYYDDDEHT
jgi:hypothetical protein